MKISELIKILEEFKTIHGDLPCFIEDVVNDYPQEYQYLRSSGVYVATVPVLVGGEIRYDELGVVIS